MRRRVGLLLLTLLIICASGALACGDKFVVFGQGVRFQRAYAATHPASILVYLKPGSRWTSPESRDRLLTVLRMVGHHPQAVSTVDELQAAMGTGTFDVVLTEFSTLPATTQIVSAARSRATIIPMVFEPAPPQLAELERQNTCTVQVSKRSHELLTVINDVMALRLKGVGEACQRKKA
jgi:hypothetical protein